MADNLLNSLDKSGLYALYYDRGEWRDEPIDAAQVLAAVDEVRAELNPPVRVPPLREGIGVDFGEYRGSAKS